MTAYKGIILNFTGIYEYEENLKRCQGLKWVNCSDIRECNMYCSKTSEDEIKKRIRPYGYYGVHFLDSGNYHYITKFITDEVKRDFTLLVIDHHNDMQEPIVSGMTSCGGWVLQAFNENSYLKEVIIIGTDNQESDIDKRLLSIPLNRPVYVSIDKDVLSEKHVATNWDQGNMSPETLKGIITYLMMHFNVLGIDVCGECDMRISSPSFKSDVSGNDKINIGIYKQIYSVKSAYKVL